MIDIAMTNPTTKSKPIKTTKQVEKLRKISEV